MIFGAGLALSLYRDYIMALPDKFANRDGLFRVISWR